MTGDSVRAETQSWLESTDMPVLRKPFSLETLVRTIEGAAPQPA